MTEYIEREEAIKRLKELHFGCKDFHLCGGVLLELNALYAIPAVDVAPVVHGKWIHLVLMPDDVTGHTYGECSHCRKLRIVDNFCPNCGAVMDLEDQTGA